MPLLIVSATSEAMPSPLGRLSLNPAWGQASIDGYEVLHFANAATLRVLGAGGSDQFVVDSTIVAAGLATIEVVSADPTGLATVLGSPASDLVTFYSRQGRIAELRCRRRANNHGLGRANWLTADWPVGIVSPCWGRVPMM